MKLKALVLPGTLVLATFLIMACGGAQEETAEPAAPAAPAPQTTVPPAPTATPVGGGQAGRISPASLPAAPAPTVVSVAETSEGPYGELRVGMKSVGVPLYRNQEGAYPRNRYHYAFASTETLTYWSPGTEDPTGLLAESWEFADDMSEFIFHMRQGVPFHKGWGEMTAEDAAYSYNDAGADNPATKHDNGTEISQTYGVWFARDKYTAVAPIKTVRLTWGEWDINREGSSAANIFSKRVFDEEGPVASITTLVGTGPYDVQEWVSGERMTAEALPDHWRIVPKFHTLTALEIPEETTLLAMMRTEKLDISEMSVKNIGVLSDEGMDVNDTLGKAWTQVIFYAGNYWQKIHSETGEPVPRHSGFKPDHPWVGDPDDPEHFARALKVRQALNMAIDRDAINQSIMGGLARRADMLGVPNNTPYFRDRWITEYNPEMAKQLLAEAGYPDGFKMPYFFPPDFGLVSPEAAEAVAAMWENIGIDVAIERTAYTTRRPTMIDRSIDIPWYWMSTTDMVDYDSEQTWLATAHVGWQPGMQTPELWEFRKRLHEALDSEDEAQIRQVLDERSDFLQSIMIMSPIVDMPKLAVTNPETVGQGWVMYDEGAGLFNNFETIEHAK